MLLKKFTLTVLVITLLQVISFAKTKTVNKSIEYASIINIRTGKVADNQVIVVKNGEIVSGGSVNNLRKVILF